MSSFEIRPPSSPTKRSIVFLRDGSYVSIASINYVETSGSLVFYGESLSKEPFAVSPPGGWNGVVEQ